MTRPFAMPRGLRLSLAMRLGLFLATITALLALGMWVRTRVFSRLLVSGPAYQQIAENKQLADDFNPPSQYIDGAFVGVDELVDDAPSGDTAAVARKILAVQSVRVEYLEARKIWRDHPPHDQSLAALMDSAAEPALAFFRAFDEQLLPAIERRDYPAARAIREGVLDSLFRVHVERVAEVRDRARATVRDEELAATRTMSHSTQWLLVGTIVAIALLFAISWIGMSRVVVRPLRDAIAHVTAIGHGRYDVAIDVTRRDEIGEMLMAIDAMRNELRTSTNELRGAKERIQVSEERFALAMRGTNEGLWEMSLETNAGYFSPRWFEMLGYSGNEVAPTFETFVGLLHPDDKPTMQATHEALFAGRTEQFQLEFRLHHKDGHYIPVLSRAAVSRNTDGKAIRLVGTILDLTELRTAQTALGAAEQKYHDIVEHSPEGIYQTTPEGHPLMINQACARLFGYDDPGEALRSLESSEALYADPGRRAEFIRLLNQFGSVVGFQARMRRKDGSIIWASNSARIVRDDQGKLKYIEGFIEDVTARQLQEETIVHMATHDPLTDLPNRRAMDEAVLRAITRARRGETSAFLLVDIDNFKAINDSVGHPAGDRFLQSLGPLFHSALRPTDVLARFGGDEFAVLLEGVTPRRARAVAERLRDAIGEFRFQEGTYTFAPTASLGVALIEDGQQQPAHIVSVADAALHAAKDQGKNRCVVYEALTEREVRLTEASQWAARIKDALREDRLVLHFQPIVRLSDGGVAFNEALVRMREPDGTLIGPSAFIPAAERFGLASAIDEWVVNAAVKALRDRPGLPLCVNLSGTSLSDEMLLQRIERSLAAADAAPRQLVFEITETAVVQDLVRARRWMERLSRLGCRFALDDFGMGFSSFSYLRSLPVDKVKIDGSFIRTICTDPTSGAVVSAITGLAHALGKRVIAEWVEDRATADRLVALGVDYGQGYLWSPPSSLETVGVVDRDEMAVA